MGSILKDAGVVTIEFDVYSCVCDVIDGNNRNLLTMQSDSCYLWIIVSVLTIHLSIWYICLVQEIEKRVGSRLWLRTLL